MVIKKEILANINNKKVLLPIIINRKYENIYINTLYDLINHKILSFPYFNLLYTQNFVISQFNKLKNYNYIIDNNIFKYNDSDYNLNKITDYFTGYARMQCKAGKTDSPINIFEHKNFIKKLIKNNDIISSHIIREFLWKNSKECSNFKITLVVSICKLFNAKRYLDISVGWGDRMIGALASNVDYYLGYDPNTMLKRGHNLIKNIFDPTNKCKILYEPFEIANINENFDIVFSSPPFFIYENYSTDPNQSVEKYPKFNDWLNKFLFISLSKAFNALISGGHMIIHMNNIPKYNIIDPMVNYLKKIPNSQYLEELYTEGSSGKLIPMFIIRKI